MNRLFCSVSCIALLACASLPASAQEAASTAPTSSASSDVMAAPSTAMACRRLAESRLKSGEAETALTLLKHGLEIDAHDADLYAALADTQTAKGRTEDARHSWQMAVGEGTDQAWSSSRMLDGDLQLRYALWLTANGDYDEAARMYTLGCDSLDTTDRSLLPVKWSAKELKRNEAARRRFNAALNTALGLRCIALKRPDSAETAFQAALTAVPGDPLAEFHRGRLLLQKGQKDAAVAAWKRVAENTLRLDLRASAVEALAKAN